MSGTLFFFLLAGVAIGQTVYTYQLAYYYTRPNCTGLVTTFSATDYTANPGACSPAPCGTYNYNGGSALTTCTQLTVVPTISYFTSLCPGCQFCAFSTYLNGTCPNNVYPAQFSVKAINHCGPWDATRPTLNSSFIIYTGCDYSGQATNWTSYYENTCVSVKFSSTSTQATCNPNAGTCIDTSTPGQPPSSQYGFCSIATATPPATTTTAPGNSSTTRPASASLPTVSLLGFAILFLATIF